MAEILLCNSICFLREESESDFKNCVYSVISFYFLYKVIMKILERIINTSLHLQNGFMPLGKPQLSKSRSKYIFHSNMKLSSWKRCLHMPHCIMQQDIHRIIYTIHIYVVLFSWTVQVQIKPNNLHIFRIQAGVFEDKSFKVVT